MSRSNYSDDCENLELWRGNVERTIKGKKGQALLRELEAALVALPEKRLISDDMARMDEAHPADSEVCALGCVALKRGLDQGKDRLTVLKEIMEQFPEGCEASELADDFDISEMLAREITYVNDEMAPDRPEKRYEYVLSWVRSKIISQ